MAGAGTGKTAVIGERFRSLIADGVARDAVLVMTFTERAAAEMRDRIERALRNSPGDLQVGTFHALAQGWLREDGARIGIPAGFRILAGADRWIAFRELLWESGEDPLVGTERPDDLVAPLLRILEGMKQELVPIARLRTWARTSVDPEQRALLLSASRLFDLYVRRCRSARLLEFDDLLAGAVRLFERCPDVLARYRSRFRWLMVDEYQDTNLAQERIVELLSGPDGNVCVVGDDDQSIYRFRGASRANLERFAKAFPNAATVSLGRNRRSARRIVAASAQLIRRNPDRIEKTLTASAPGGSVEIWECADGAAEVAAIVAEAQRLVQEGARFRDLAVLARTNAMLQPLLAALAGEGVPYQTWGARGFFERPEVKDVIAYLRLIQDPGDEVALARLLGERAAGLDVELALIRIAAGRRRGMAPLESLAGWAPAAAWVALVQDLIVLKSRLGVDDLVFELLSRTRHLELAPAATAVERRRMAANLGKLAEMVAEFCERSPDHSLRAFMDRLHLVLLSGVDEDTARVEDMEDAVQLMTIHQAKGLEFDVVFVAGLVEGRLPQPARSEGLELPGQVVDAAQGREDRMAEERRLCYVAMTRARRHLRLSWAKRYEGSRRWRPSRFLAELAGDGAGAVPRRVVGPPPPSAPPLAGRRAVRRTGADAILLSFSAVSAYRDCPRQYWFRYLHRVPAAESVEARQGTLMHEALRELGQSRMRGEEVTAELVEAVYRRSWARAEALAAPADPRLLPALRRVGLAQLERYRLSGGFAGRPEMVEHSFTADLDGWRLTGVIDRIDRIAPDLEEGGRPGAAPRWRLVDYKTGAPTPASQLRRDLQLALYALGARHALAIPPAEAIELEIVYLKGSGSVRVPAGDDLLREADRAGRLVAEDVGGGRFPTRPERRRCRLCPYRLACPDAL